MSSSPWLVPLRKLTAGELVLICLPHAGGSASVFRPWQSASERLDMVAVQLPGRENRFGEPARRSLTELLDELVPAITGLAGGRYAFFGHSMGALLAFEVAQRLRHLRSPAPEAMFVSGCPAPYLSTGGRDPVYDLPEPELIEWLDKVEGISAEVREYPELLKLMLPTLRADLEIVDTYQYEERPPLGCPIHVLMGVDDPEVTPAEAKAWRDHTSGDFGLVPMRGGHFCVHENVDQAVSVMEDLLGVRRTT